MKNTITLTLVFTCISILCSCNSNKNIEMKILKSNFGVLPDGEEVYKYQLSNSKLSVDIINYGGIITNINLEDSQGKIRDIVLGFDDIDKYVNGHPYFGSIIGRYGNRIANGKFEIEKKEYQLNKNNGRNSLHGGLKGFDKVIWGVKEIKDTNMVGIKLNYFSKHLEEGYPGNLDVTVTYTLNNENELKIKYEAKTDKTTVVNLTQHSYFNLAGESSGNILDHLLYINADSYLPVTESLIPTGEIRKVENTPFDFNKFKKIGMDINNTNSQLEYGIGYHHCWVLNDYQGNVRKVAEAKSLKTGIQMEVFTDQPGIQFYTGNFLDGTLKSKKEKTYEKRYGFCLETQHFPDSPNQPNFPNTFLTPEESYKTETWFRFSNSQINN